MIGEIGITLLKIAVAGLSLVLVGGIETLIFLTFQACRTPVECEFVLFFDFLINFTLFVLVFIGYEAWKEEGSRR